MTDYANPRVAGTYSGDTVQRAIRHTLISAIILALALVAGQGAEVRCRVLRIIDGDTIDILADGARLRIRFEGVDSPEAGQAGGTDATAFTTRMLKDKVVTVRLLGAHESRIIGRVVADGSDASVELVRAGMAWHYASLSKDMVLAQLEKEARARKLGLWSQPNPIPPWEYRRYAQKPQSAPPGGPFHGNVESRIFHRPGCVNYRCASCTRAFATRDQALKAGYKPCRVCKP